jgi:hypothetical protein
MNTGKMFRISNFLLKCDLNDKNKNGINNPLQLRF